MRRFTIIVVTSLLLATPIFADARDDYKNGVAALEAGKFTRARDLLQQAIEQSPASKKPMIGRAYLPHFYLGKTLFGLGDCRGALESWRESERQGAVEKAKTELSELKQKKRACQERLREFDAALASAQARHDEATRVSVRVGQLETDELLSEVWSEGDDSLEKRQIEAVKPLFMAKDKLREAKASADIAIANQAADLATQAIESLEALEALADQRRKQIEAHRKDLAQRLRRALSGADSALMKTEGTSESIPGIDALRARLRKLVADGRSKKDRSDAELRSLSDRINSLSNGLKRATKMPPEELLVAAAAFLGNDYLSVLDVLHDYEGSDGRIAAQVCLLRSAALHASQRLGLPLPLRATDLTALESPYEEPAELGEESDSQESLSDTATGMLDADLDMPSESSTSEDFLTALDVLLACVDMPVDLEPGPGFFPPSYLELFAEYRRLQAAASLDESP